MWLYIILIVLLVISVGANIAMGIVIKNNLLKISIYEGWIVDVADECKHLYINLKQIDDRQLFEKDDDVGATFDAILNIVKDFDEKIQYEKSKQ